MEQKLENPNDFAVMFTEKYLKGKTYSFVKKTGEYVIEIAKSSCTLPTLKEEN